MRLYVAQKQPLRQSILQFIGVAHYVRIVKAQDLPKEEFKREVERHLTGKDTEPWEMLYFKVYKSQLAVIEQALEISSLMLGGNKARGYCLDMICADFLAGANLDPAGKSRRGGASAIRLCAGGIRSGRRTRARLGVAFAI